MLELIKEFHNYCIKNKLTVSVVESCTSGKLGDSLTTYPGSSKWFLGGLIVYTDQIKSKLLNIPIQLIKKYNAVSTIISYLMAKNGKEIFNSDICISITGFIESYCYICIIFKELVFIKKLTFDNDSRNINKTIIIEKIFKLIISVWIKDCSHQSSSHLL